MDNVKFSLSLEALNRFQSPKTPKEWVMLRLPQLLTIMADPITTPDEPLYLKILQGLTSEHIKDFEFEGIEKLPNDEVVAKTIDTLIALLSKDDCKESAALSNLLIEYKNHLKG